MLVHRYVIDLEGRGKVFLRVLKDLNLFDLRSNDAEMMLQYVYKECAVQIINFVDSDPQYFPKQIEMLPDFKYFEHIETLRYPQNLPIFLQALKTFALELMFLISHKVGLGIRCNFILESITEEYIVVAKIQEFDTPF